MIIISYDDGPDTDYTLAFQIHKKWGVPGETCVTSGRVGQKGSLGVDQLLEMQESGWEIVSHTRYHSTMRMEYLRKGASPGDTALRIKRSDHFKPGTECVLKNGRSEETVTLSEGSGEKGIVRLKSGILHSYPVNPLSIKLSTAMRWCFRRTGLPAVLTPLVRKIDSLLNVPLFSIDRSTALLEIEQSKEDLTALGLKVSNFTYPYNDYDEQYLALLGRHYTSVRVSGKRLNRISGRKSANGYPLLLYSHNFAEGRMSDAQLGRVVASTGPGNVGIMYIHSWSKGFTTGRLAFLIETAMRLEKKIVTRQQILAAF